MNRAEVAENLGLDGAASISVVGVHANMNIQQSLNLKSMMKLKLMAYFKFTLLFVTPGPKPMETWCGEEVSMGNSWEQEEEVEIGMWSNSQQDNRSSDQNTWNYKHKGSYKVS